MSDETVTIRAEMVTDIPEQAGKSAAALKALGEAAKTSATSGAGATSALGKSIDDVGDKSAKVSTGGMSKLTKSMKDLDEQGKKVREGLAGIGETITEKLTYPMQQLSYALEAAALGIVGFGLATYSGLQQANLQLTMFSGNATTGGTALTALMALRDPASLGALQGSYETLVNAGSSSSSALRLTKALAGAGAVSGNSDALLGTTSSALADITQTGGKITAADMFALQKAFPQVFNLLGKDMGESGSSLRTAFAYGRTVEAPSGFFGQLESTRQATGGLAAYDKTFEGQFGQAKTAVGGLLAVIETPLGVALGNSAKKLDAWAGGVEGRFKMMSGRLGADWKDGNIGGFATTLATVLGDPKLASGIKTVTQDLRDMGSIITGSVIPAFKVAGVIVVPALKALSDILDIMAAHKTTTEALIVTLGGFVILSQIGQWGLAARAGILAFSAAVEEGGVLSAVSSLTRGMMGLKAAEVGVAGGEAGVDAAMGVGGVASMGEAGSAIGGGSAAAGSLGFLGPVGAVGLGVYELESHINYANKAWLRDTSIGGTNLPNVSKLRGAGAIGKAASASKGLHGNYSLPSGGDYSGINVGTMNVNLAGNGNPEKVANAIPKNINAQVKSYNQMQSRRTGNG